MSDWNATGHLLRPAGPADALDGAGRITMADARLRDVLDVRTPVFCLYDQASFSEGTVWDARRGRLVWSDIVGRRVLAWYPDGCVKVVVDATAFINGNAVDRNGDLVHCEHGRRCISRSDENGVATPFITQFEGRAFNSPNDITLARDGSLWFSDPCFGLNMPKQGALRDPDLDHRSVYRYDPDSGQTRRMADFEQPNGLEFSPDGRTLYVSDTSRALDGALHEIVAFDVADDNGLSNRRRFRMIDPGVPDGFAIDARGWIWTTSGSGVQIFDPDGAFLGQIPTPEPCSNCALRDDGSRLFIASGGRLLAVDLHPSL